MRISLLAHPSPARSRRFTVRSRSRQKLAVSVSLALLLCTGSMSRAQATSGRIGYCGSGIAIGIGAIAGGGAALGIFLAVNHGRHLLEGCVSTGPDGPQLQTSDAKTFALQGDPAIFKVGDRVKVHGDRVRRSKDSKGNQVFKVDKIKRNYGPCQITQTRAAPARQAHVAAGS